MNSSFTHISCGALPSNSSSDSSNSSSDSSRPLSLGFLRRLNAYAAPPKARAAAPPIKPICIKSMPSSSTGAGGDVSTAGGAGGGATSSTAGADVSEADAKSEAATISPGALEAACTSEAGATTGASCFTGTLGSTGAGSGVWVTGAACCSVALFTGFACVSTGAGFAGGGAGGVSTIGAGWLFSTWVAVFSIGALGRCAAKRWAARRRSELVLAYACHCAADGIYRVTLRYMRP